jgi:OOP family OmpA-OmpF porin
MKDSQIMLLNAFAIAVLAMTGIASANEINKDGYLIDSSGTVVRSGAGLCWHTSSWTPALAIAECDPVAKKPAPVIAEAAPAPAPTPVPASAPARIVQKKTVFVPYTMETETLFAYNNSDMSEGGKQKLHDEIIVKMQEEPRDEVVVISGYTDRIGSEDYNIKLSQRRADAVKTYMVDQGVDGNRIETAAKGKADPIVSCDNIKGKVNRKNKALIACLQPNRRIVLDLKGLMPVQK